MRMRANFSGRLAAALLLVMALAWLGGCRNAVQESGGPIEIVVWHPWGQDQVKGLQRAVARYHKSQNKVRVRLVFTPNDLSSNQKFFTAIAANKPPDVSFVDGTQVAQWAEWNALEPLDKYIQQDGVKSDDFYVPSWKQSQYKGKTWALTFSADPNFAFAWNKNAFRKAGLDPNTPPRTIADLDRMARVLTRSENNTYKSIGIIPWAQYGSANSIFTWGWAFGGEFYDEKTQTVTANDPKVVEAVTWIVDYARRLGITRVNSTTAGWGAGASNPFFSGQIAMTCAHVTSIADYKRYAPNLDYGIAPMPGTPSGEIGSSWVGGYLVALPRGCAHPDAAWDFVRWLCATPQGTESAVAEMGILPGYRKSPSLEVARRDPKRAMFVKILDDTKHQRPVMPAQSFFMGALDRALDRALYGKQTPQQAMDQATVETQRELDLILGKKVKG